MHYRTAGEGKPLVIVHGLFGSGDNWLTLAGKFPGWKVYLPDLRNHGSSPWFDSFSLSDLARDLETFAEELNLGRCPWIGHSLGGKAVMELALSFPSRVSAIAVLDMAPRASEARYQGFVPTLLALDLSRISSRTEAQAQLESKIPDKPTLQFLLKSLVLDRRQPGRLKWSLNLESLNRHYPEIWKAIEGSRQWTGPAYFLRGGASDFFRPGDEELALRLFPEARFAAVAGAGHWLHAEKPAEVLAALHQWLAEIL